MWSLKKQFNLEADEDDSSSSESSKSSESSESEVALEEENENVHKEEDIPQDTLDEEQPDEPPVTRTRSGSTVQ
jgi:hypothetical protein